MLKKMFSKGFVCLYSALIAIVLTGCASLPVHLEKPTVTLENIALVEGNLLAPRFKVDLRVTNPNNRALPISGISYAISVLDVELFKGVESNIPEIKPYGDTTLSVILSTNILKAGHLLKAFTEQSAQTIGYEVKAKIDLQGLLPSFNVTESGDVPLRAP